MSPRVPGTLAAGEKVLRVVRRLPGLTVAEVAHRTGMRYENTLDLIQKMERAGTIERKEVKDSYHANVGKRGIYVR